MQFARPSIKLICPEAEKARRLSNGRGRGTHQYAIEGWHPLPTDQSVSSSSSHTRKPFHKRGMSDSADHWHRCAAMRTDASTRLRATVSRTSLPYSLVPILPEIEPTAKEWFGFAVEQGLKPGQKNIRRLGLT